MSLNGQSFTGKKRTHQGGMILSHHPSVERQRNLEPRPPVLMKTFKCKVTMGGTGVGIPVGFCAIMSCHTANIAVCITDFLETIDLKTGQTIKTKPRALYQGDSARVLMRPYADVAKEKGWTKKEVKQAGRTRSRKPKLQGQNPLRVEPGHCVDTYERCDRMGRFMLINSQRSVLVGIIEEVNPPALSLF